jgi:hypothetical protein
VSVMGRARVIKGCVKEIWLLIVERLVSGRTYYLQCMIKFKYMKAETDSCEVIG